MTLFVYQEAMSEVCRLDEAKKIMTDVIPGEEPQAEKLLINCIRMNPKYLEPILELAQLIELRVSVGERPLFDIHKSLALVSQAYALDPNSAKVRYAMAHMLGTIGQYEEAQSLYEKTMEEFPNNKETLVEKAKLLVEKDPDASLKLIQESVKMGTNVDDVIEIISSGIRYKSGLSSYSKSFSLVALQYKNRWLYHKLGLIYLEEKQFELAQDAFKRSVELGNTVEAKLQLAIVQYQYLKDFHNSILNFESLIKELELRKTISNSSRALVYAHYSLALFANNNIQSASNAAVQVVLKSSANRDYIKFLAYEYKSRHALQVLQPALELVTLNDPTSDLAFAFLGEIYKQTKNYAKALEVLDKAIILNPKNDAYYAIKGTVFYKSSNYEEALTNYDYALLLNPGKPAYLYNKACVLALLGKKTESLFYLKIVLNADKNFVSIAENDSDFSTIKSDINYSKEFASLFFQNYDSKWAATSPSFKSHP